MGHGFIAVELPTRIPEKTTMVYLHLGPGWLGDDDGYRIDTTPLPYSVQLTVGLSTEAANRELLEIWRMEEILRRKGGENWNVVNNCWFPIWAHYDHGGVYISPEPQESGVDPGGP